MMRMSRAAIVMLLATSLVGCATSEVPAVSSASAPRSVGPTVVPSNAPTARVAPSRTPWPSVVAPAETSTEALADDLRLTLEIDQQPLRPGVKIWATMSVTNVGKRTLHYSTDGCEIPIHAWASLTGPWLQGAAQSGVAAEAKSRTLASGTSHGATSFVAEHLVGRDVGCADYASPHRLEPGAVITQRSLWQPFEDAPMPDVTAEIVAYFPFDRWEGDDEPEGPRRAAEVRLPSAILGGATWPWLTPAEAIDAGLADAEFLSWLEAVPPDAWSGPSLELDPDAATWTLAVYQETAVDWIASLTIDATTGAILKRRFE